MYIVYKTLRGFYQPFYDDSAPKFMPLLKAKWEEIHSKANVFRYKIDNLKKRIVEEKYLLQLNPERVNNRRTPELVSCMSQPFSEEKFNFTKVSRDEVMFSVGSSADDPELHSFIVNVSPISRYHTLFCPFINRKLPQVMTQESLLLALQVMFIANNSNLKMAFNSLCGLASVNHLHFHLFMESDVLPVEQAEREFLIENVCCLVDYPVPALCFEIDDDSIEYQVKEVYRLVKYLQDQSIAHNIFISMRNTLDIVDIYVYPRKSASGVKQLTTFNMAVLELSGWFPVFTKEAFHNLKSEDLENEMKKWKYPNFKKLVKEFYGMDIKY